MTQMMCILLGLTAGVFGGMFGIGGGVILIPAMVYFFGLTQHQAQGTTLAIMVPPIGLLAAWRYYQSGNVKLGMAVLICAGFRKLICRAPVSCVRSAIPKPSITAVCSWPDWKTPAPAASGCWKPA